VSVLVDEGLLLAATPSKRKVGKRSLVPRTKGKAAGRDKLASERK
jgi:hypothetical protein